MRRAFLLLVLLALAAAAAVPQARADGDPASDVLLSVPVFFPFDVKFPKTSQTGLTQTVRSAKQGGYQVRVALIPRRYDLGIVTPLWMKPQQYAHFLAQELAFVYRGRLLVAMPNGYGVYWCTGHGHGPCAASHPLAVEKKALAALPPPSASTDLAVAATTAVRKLAAARGVKLVAVPPPKASKANGSEDSTGDRLRIGAGALALGAFGFAIWAVWKLRSSG